MPNDAVPHDAPITPAAGAKPFLNPFAESQDQYQFPIFETTAKSGYFHEVKLPEFDIGDRHFRVSKFEVLLLASAIITFTAMVFLARRFREGHWPRGVLQNLLESFIYFVRDSIARPAIGEHDGDKYVPYLATTFIFILVSNLMGMIPFLGSPTASIAVTAALALVSFVVTHVAGIRENGVGGYLKSFIPHIELDGPARYMKIFLVPLIAVLELMTPFIRVFVLCVRLFANMLAGHTALFVLMFFIRLVSDPTWTSYLKLSPNFYYVVAPFSVLMVTALSILELMVAVLQAFIFTLLSAIFIGLAKHPAH